MELRLFIGPKESEPLLRAWLQKRHPQASELNLDLQERNRPYLYLSWGEVSANFLLQAASHPKGSLTTFNVFLEPRHFYNFIELQKKIPRSFSHHKKYFYLSLKEHSLQISWREEDPKIPLSDPLEQRALVVNYGLENFSLLKNRHQLDENLFLECYVQRTFWRRLTQEIKTSLNHLSLENKLEAVFSSRPKLKEKIKNILITPSPLQVAALGYFLNCFNFTKPAFDENDFFSFLKHGYPLIFIHLSSPEENFLFEELGSKKTFALISKLSPILNSYLLLGDCISLANLLDNNTVRELISIQRIRHLRQIHDLMVDESFYLSQVSEDPSLAQEFSHSQVKFAKLNSSTLVVPQNIEELKVQARQFRNCSLTYAKEVALKKIGYLAYYYENRQAVACIYFDEFRNIIEISGVKNQALSSAKEDQIRNFLHSGLSS